MPSVVHVVIHCGTEAPDSYPIGVFSTEEKAQACLKREDKKLRYSFEHNYVQPFTLDEYEVD